MVSGEAVGVARSSSVVRASTSFRTPALRRSLSYPESPGGHFGRTGSSLEHSRRPGTTVDGGGGGSAMEEGVLVRDEEAWSLAGRFLDGGPSHWRPFSRHWRQLISPLHLIFFLLQLRHAAVTRPERLTLWRGSEMNSYVRSPCCMLMGTGGFIDTHTWRADAKWQCNSAKDKVGIALLAVGA